LRTHQFLYDNMIMLNCAFSRDVRMSWDECALLLRLSVGKIG